MFKRRNATEKEISKVVSDLYEYGTDFPGRIAQKLYDMGYRKVEVDSSSILP